MCEESVQLFKTHPVALRKETHEESLTSEAIFSVRQSSCKLGLTREPGPSRVNLEASMEFLRDPVNRRLCSIPLQTSDNIVQ
jgi:hypothetical protein